MAYRGKRNEALHNIFDNSLNHVNFLEIIKLISKYDSILETHVAKMANKSKVHSENKSRGSLVTFLSKTTVNSLMNIIRHLIQDSIAKEIKDENMFSIEMDTTQDVSCADQCSIVVRYTYEGIIIEKLLFLLKAEGSSGENLYTLMEEQLKKLNIEIRQCIGDSFDGAANMSGQYKGVQARIKEVADNHVHVWCYAHSLNLVLCDTTSSVVPAMSFFSLLNLAANSFSASHKRMAHWEKFFSAKVGSNKLKRLTKIGKTRWWAKASAVTKIFGNFNAEDTCNILYIDLVVILFELSQSEDFNAPTRDEARTLLERFLKYDTILTAVVFSRIFEITSPLSKYLQTNGLNILQAWRLVGGHSKSTFTQI